MRTNKREKGLAPGSIYYSYMIILLVLMSVVCIAMTPKGESEYTGVCQDTTSLSG